MKIFLKQLTLTLAAAAFLFQNANAQTTPDQQKQLTPKQVLAELLEGNKRYTADKLSPPNLKTRIKKTAKGQYPKAVILSCLDSRVPVEWIFDQGIGDIFVGRVAGNVENKDQLGSMEFATKLAGSKLVIVLGHTACGAVKGACDNAKLGNLTDLLQKIQPAVNAVKDFPKKDRHSKNTKFVNAVVKQNVIQTVSDIRKRSQILNQMEKDGEIMIVGALYDLHTGKVTLLQ